MIKKLAGLLLIAFIIITGCTENPVIENTHLPVQISLDQAKKLVENNSLREITTDEVWQIMGAQVFTGLKNSTGTSYLIKGSKVTELCSGFGGLGINSMLVCDLNQDKCPDLIYSFSWGSGVNGTDILAFTQDRVIGPAWRSNYHKGFEMKKLNDNIIELLSDNTKIGEIKFAANKGSQTLEVVLNKNVTQEIIDSILLNPLN